MGYLNYISITFAFVFLVACDSEKPAAEQSDTTIAVVHNEIPDSIFSADPQPPVSKDLRYDTSTYDDPNLSDITDRQRSELKELSDLFVFNTIQLKLLPSLNKKHQLLFKAKSVYELLFFAKGDLFHHQKEDYAFIVYDKEHQRIAILTYNAWSNQYLELYRGIKVENKLDATENCYSTFGTLDYQIADEIVYFKESLIKDPEFFLENTPCKVVNIFQDKTFSLENGCFADSTKKENDSEHELCIATSYVYENWECLKYDKDKQTFHVFYGQAFAD